MYPPFWLPRKEGTYHFCHLVQPDYVEQWTIFAPWFNLEYLEVASNLGLFRVRYKGKRISPKDMLDFYNKAYFRFMDKCKVNKIVIDYVQLGTMRELKSILECLVFEEL